MSSPLEIRIEAGTEIDPLLQNVLASLTDEEIDEIEVKREFAPVTGLASEPVTIAAIILASVKAATALGTALAAYIKYKTEKLKAENVAPAGPRHPAPIVIKISPSAPPSLRNLRGTDYVRVTILP